MIQKTAGTLSREEVEKIIKRYHSLIEQTYREGMEDYQQSYLDTRHKHSAVTRANLVRDHVVDRAKDKFAGVEGVEIKGSLNGLFALKISGTPVGIDGCVLIRFKKLNSQLLTSNSSTKQAQNFDQQRPLSPLMYAGVAIQLTFDWGIPEKILGLEPTHINAGYIPNALWTKIEMIYITCPKDRNKLAFYYQLNEELPQNQAQIFEIPVVTEVEPVRKRIRAKTHKFEKKANEPGN